MSLTSSCWSGGSRIEKPGPNGTRGELIIEPPRAEAGAWLLTGLGDAQYEAVRREVGRTLPGKSAGRSLTVRLALSRNDPGPALDAAVVGVVCHLS